MLTDSTNTALWQPYQIAALVLLIVFACFALNPIPQCIIVDRDVRCSDYAFYMNAIQAVWSGDVSSIYRPESIKEVTQQLLGGNEAFPLPLNITPVAMFLAAPMAYAAKLYYQLAYAGWVALSLALFALVVSTFQSTALPRAKAFLLITTLCTLSSFSTLKCISVGQSAILFGAILTFSHLPLGALPLGIAAVVLAAKPQYFAVICGGFIIFRNWRAFAYSLLILTPILALMTAQLGIGWPIDYLENIRATTTPIGASLFPDGTNSPTMVTFKTTFGSLLGAELAAKVSWALLAATFLVTVILAEKIGRLRAATALPLLLILFQPHGYPYELLLILPPTLVLIQQSAISIRTFIPLVILQSAVLNQLGGVVITWVTALIYSAAVITLMPREFNSLPKDDGQTTLLRP